MTTRPVRYELHIRPLIRLIDREKMVEAKGFDLWDYEQTRAKADKILLHAPIDMPPRGYGGPWPAEWVALFQRWKDEGFLRLELGLVDSEGYQATRVGGIITLTGQGETPNGEYRAWLDGVVSENGPREYVHYWEPSAANEPPDPTPFRVKTSFAAPETVTEIAVVDANGRHIVAVKP